MARLFPLPVLFLLISACGTGTVPPGTPEQIRYSFSGQKRTATASRPAGRINGDPAVILITPDLRHAEFRTNTAGTNRYLALYDHYLNNAGISLIRFSRKGRSTATLSVAVAETRALLSVLRKKSPERRITLLTFGSAAYAGLILAGEVSDLSLVMVGPPFREYERILRWRILEEPNRHFGSCFDMDGDGRVSRTEFEQDTYRVRDELYRGMRFGDLDRDRDGSITGADFSLANRVRFRIVRRALLLPDKPAPDAARILGPAESIPWIASVAAFSRTNTVPGLLRRIKREVYIFHGSDDRMIPADESRAIGKTGLPYVKVHIEGGHDHELNWGSYALNGRLPRGMFFLFRALFQVSGAGKG